jgi:poly-beta-hydroxyalkanoate depolymerase
MGDKGSKKMAHVAPNMDVLIARARAHKMTPTERREQRVSMVMGLRGHTSTLTKEKVETLLDDLEGSAH